jgi:hypothetical protein
MLQVLDRIMIDMFGASTFTLFVIAFLVLTMSINKHVTYLSTGFFQVISLHFSKYYCVLVNIPFMLLLHAVVHC